MSNIQITENESGKYSPEWFYNEAQKPEWIAFIRKADTLHENFINHFGIEHLKSLSGKELLTSLFYNDKGNKLNLCYVLEMDKDMREIFGSIAGGAAYKFGLFFHKKTQSWTCGSPAKPVKLTENEAIQKAEEKGLLGKNILNSGFDFDLKISQGAGAFVCGEGSALTASIEGNRGMPRVKPPRTVEKGLFEKPTVLNNVETYCNVPPIINKGAAWYKTIGPDKNHGTKAFALTGNVMNTGLIEVPMGTPLRKVIFDIGGGVKGGEFKAVQIGGPSGGCLCINPSEDHLNLQLDFDSLKKVGAMIGSGGLVVMNDKSCMVEVARFFMNFTQNESCGKCIPCREGTKRMLELLTDICEGRGTMQHITLLEELSETISATALCGLGKTAASPVVSTMKYFRDEYIAHVVDKKCPAGQCKALVTLQIDPELCKGCSKCSRVCPVGAISGEIKKPFKIDTTKCIKCGACKEGCPFHAVKEV